MKKAFDQTVRDLKRGVNKNVLKVPSIEQKVLDATSNEPWGPHGSLLSDIAQASRNYHEYQIIMSVIWKRANDTGKNWRHVYKALTVLEYLVAHGSERVIDDIREHAYQISALSDFQYIDSRGKDQGNNVRKKSQSIVVLVNDKERIQEVRQKAAANRDKYRSTAVGSSSGGYGDRFEDDRYGNRDDDRNGYGRDRDWGSRDDGRDYEDRYGRDGYRDDDYRGRSQQNDEYSYNSRSRSVDRDRNSANEDDGRYSSRGSGGKGDDHSQDGSTRAENLDRKYSGQNLSAPPSYEEVVGTGRSPSYSDRDGEYSQPNAPKESNASDATQKDQPTTAGAPTPASPPVLDPATIPAPPPTSVPAPTTAPTLPSQNAVQHSQQEVGGFDAFDPRGPSSAASTTSGTAPTSGFEMDLLGSLSIVPVSQPTTSSETNDSASINAGPFQATPPSSAITNQPFDDPFGDGPFTAVPTTGGASIQPQTTHPPNSFSSNPSQGVDVHQPAPNATTEFAGAFNDTSHSSLVPSGAQLHTSAQFPTQELSAPNQEIDILAGILPPSESSSSIDRQGGYPVPPSQPVSGNGFTQTNQPASQSDLSSLTGYNAQQTIQAQTRHPTSFITQHSQPSSQANYHFPSPESVSQTGYPSQGIPLKTVQAGQAPQFGFHSQTGSVQPNMPNYNFPGAYTSPSPAAQAAAAYTVPPSSAGTATMHSFPPQSSSMVHVTPHMVPQTPQARPNNLVSLLSTHPSSAVPAAASQPTKDKFETKSSVWADTLSRGLVNLDISGSKANPLADIGVDFDSINRKEKRMEKPTTAAVISTVTMGKAMGSGSGRGQAGSSGLRPSQNQMMGSGMNMGMAGGPGAGFGMAGGYGVNQPMGRGMGMGMGMSMPGNMGVGMGMNMNMGPGMNMNMGPRMGPGMNMNMGPGMNMQQPMGFPPGSAMPGGYNHMVGPGYSQQPQGGGYR